MMQYMEIFLLLVLGVLLVADLWEMRQSAKSNKELMDVLKKVSDPNPCQCAIKGECPRKILGL